MIELAIRTDNSIHYFNPQTDYHRIYNFLTVWNARNPYSKEKKRSYPYLLVMDFELAQEATGLPDVEQGDFAILDDEDSQLPF